MQYQLNGRVLRAAPYVLNGATTFVFDLQLEAETGTLSVGDIVRVSLHSNYVSGRPTMAALAVTNRGDRVKLRCTGDVQEQAGVEPYLNVDHLLEFSATYAE